jgi:hypothetical protein
VSEGWRRTNVVALTDQLRTSGDAVWTAVRRELARRGIDPQHTLVATAFPDDDRFEFGIVVTEDGHVFQYGYSYLHSTEDAGEFTEWVNETDRWQSRPNSADVSAAFEVLRENLA